MATDNEPPKEGGTGLTHLVRAFGYSMTGLRSAFRHESAFRQELALCVIGIPLGLWLGGNAIERVMLVGSLVLVLVVELLNTSIENVVDRISAERHDLSRRAKDAGSAAVFVSLLLAGFVWLLVAILPRLS